MNKKTKSEKPVAEPLEIAPNQKAASSAWKIPVAVLKAAKSAGCSAFKPGGRILRTEFFAWLKNHESEAETAIALDLEKADKAALEMEKLRAQITLLRARNDRETNTTIPREVAKAEWDRASSIWQEEFSQLMDREIYRVAIIRTKARVGELFAD